MKMALKRMLIAMLALAVLGSVMLPAALAAEEPVANAKVLYVGMKETLKLYDDYGDALSAGQYKWTSSKSSVASVTSKGVVTARKAGSATITATNKSNKSDKHTFKVTVRKNKVDKLISKPSPSLVNYKSFACGLKSLEIVSPTKVVAEYYVVFNFPSNWKALKIVYVNDTISAYDKTSQLLFNKIASGQTKKMSGFKSCKGKGVRTVKATFTGKMVEYTNLQLSKYLIGGSRYVSMYCKYKH